jgi:hypothetical protein
MSITREKLAEMEISKERGKDDNDSLKGIRRRNEPCLFFILLCHRISHSPFAGW